MKNQIFKWTVSMAALVAFTLLASCESDANDLTPMPNLQAASLKNGMANTNANSSDLTQRCLCLETSYPIESLSAEEVSALAFMREEEKLAHDIYVKLYEKWNSKIFNNISNSEQRHMDAILCLLNKYELDDPANGNGIGVFTNTNLQAIYNDLLSTGNGSLAAALRVGATIEDLDIQDLLNRTAAMDNKDILAVFGELTKGSRNHLRAFNQNLTNLGETYVPAYISQNLFDDIILSPKEMGGSICGTCPNNPGGQHGNGNCDGTGNGSGNNCNGNGNGPGKGPGSNTPGNGHGHGGK